MDVKGGDQKSKNDYCLITQASVHAATVSASTSTQQHIPPQTTPATHLQQQQPSSPQDHNNDMKVQNNVNANVPAAAETLQPLHMPPRKASFARMIAKQRESISSSTSSGQQNNVISPRRNNGITQSPVKAKVDDHSPRSGSESGSGSVSTQLSPVTTKVAHQNVPPRQQSASTHTPSHVRVIASSTTTPSASTPQKNAAVAGPVSVSAPVNVNESSAVVPAKQTADIQQPQMMQAHQYHQQLHALQQQQQLQAQAHQQQQLAMQQQQAQAHQQEQEKQQFLMQQAQAHIRSNGHLETRKVHSVLCSTSKSGRSTYTLVSTYMLGNARQVNLH